MSRRLQFGLLALAVAGLPFLTARPELAANGGPIEHKNYTEQIPGTEVKFDMVAIPGGTYVMGSPPTESGRKDDEGPQHPVTVKPFWMAKLEVSWDEFDQFWKTVEELDPNAVQKQKDQKADAVSRPTPPYVDADYGHGHEKFPALCMTHHAAMEYCRWLSLMTGKAYRLPTEAEWEYACRAGTTTPYFFGDDPSKMDDYAWFAANSKDETHPRGTTHELGSKKPNPFGLHDMYGNVMEWCVDHYHKDAYAKFSLDKPTLRPVFVPTERKWSHVARGGSWADDATRLRSAARRASEANWMKHDPQRPQSIWWLTRFDIIGFRVVRAVEEQPELKDLKSKVTKESE